MPSLEKDLGPLYEGLAFLNDGWLAQDNICLLAKAHSPTPLVLRRVSLTPWAGKVLASTWACGSCSDALALYQQLLERTDGHVPHLLKNRFTVMLRRLAHEGWELHKGDN